MSKMPDKKIERHGNNSSVPSPTENNKKACRLSNKGTVYSYAEKSTRKKAISCKNKKSRSFNPKDGNQGQPGKTQSDHGDVRRFPAVLPPIPRASRPLSGTSVASASAVQTTCASRMATNGEEVGPGSDVKHEKSGVSGSSRSSSGSARSTDFKSRPNSEALEEFIDNATEADLLLEYEKVEKMHRYYDNEIQNYEADLDKQCRTLDDLVSEISQSSEVHAELTGQVAKATTDQQKFSTESTRQRVQHRTNLLSYAMYKGQNNGAQGDIDELQKDISDLRERSAIGSEQQLKEHNAMMKEELEKDLVFNENLAKDLEDAKQRCDALSKCDRKVRDMKIESLRQRKVVVEASSLTKDEVVNRLPTLPPLTTKKTDRDTPYAQKQTGCRDVTPQQQYDVTGSSGTSSRVHKNLVLFPAIQPGHVSPMLILPPLPGSDRTGSQRPVRLGKVAVEVTHTGHTVRTVEVTHTGHTVRTVEVTHTGQTVRTVEVTHTGHTVRTPLPDIKGPQSMNMLSHTVTCM